MFIGRGRKYERENTCLVTVVDGFFDVAALGAGACKTRAANNILTQRKQKKVNVNPAGQNYIKNKSTYCIQKLVYNNNADCLK